MQQSGITKGEQAARVEFGSCCSPVTTLDSKLRTENGSSSYVRLILGSRVVVQNLGSPAPSKIAPLSFALLSHVNPVWAIFVIEEADMRMITKRTQIFGQR